MRCDMCGKLIPKKSNMGGSPQRFCSVNCRVKNYRIHNLERVNRATKRYHSTPKSKMQMNAESKLRYAVSKGKLVKPSTCSVCGEESKIIHGHHSDYSKPLEVQWVCPYCHVHIHLGY